MTTTLNVTVYYTLNIHTVGIFRCNMTGIDILNFSLSSYLTKYFSHFKENTLPFRHPLKGYIHCCNVYNKY